jgi:hypothetical protein
MAGNGSKFDRTIGNCLLKLDFRGHCAIESYCDPVRTSLSIFVRINGAVLAIGLTPDWRRASFHDDSASLLIPGLAIGKCPKVKEPGTPKSIHGSYTTDFNQIDRQLLASMPIAFGSLTRLLQR